MDNTCDDHFEISCAMCLHNYACGDNDFCARCKGFSEFVLYKSNREWTTGAKRDPNDGKGRMDLLPWNAIIEVSKHCQKGAEHYGEHNVDKGIPLSSLCDSGARHLAKFMDGWTDEDHLLAAAWNILWAVQMRAKKPEMIDIPWEDKK